MSTIIKMRCVDQVLTFESTPVIASGGLDEDFLQVSFCSKWDGLARTAVFWRTEDDALHVPLDMDDSCVIPPEVLSDEGVFYLGLFGVSPEGRQRTTEVVRYTVKKGAITSGTKPSDPTPDIYTQLMARYAEVLVAAEAAVETAEAAAETAEASREAVEHLTAADVGAAPAEHTHTAADVGAAPAEHTHTAADVGAAPVGHTHTAADVGAAPAEHTHTAADVGAAPAEHTHTAADVGAATVGHTHTAAEVGAAATVTYTATVTTTWTASGDYFYQDIAVNGILATDTPIVDINSGSDNAANKLYSEAICKVFRITTSANSIRVWATEAIKTAFPIQLKVVR